MADYKLTDIVKFIDHERLVVPDFQRGFKWRSSNIERLLESLLLDYPIGAALLWRTQRSALEYRKIADVDFSDDENESAVSAVGDTQESEGEIDFILDGQQRLTSIYRIFPITLAPTEEEIDSRLQGVRFYLDLNKLGLPHTLSNLNEQKFTTYEDPETLSNAILEKTHTELRKEYRRVVGPGAPAPTRLNEDQVIQVCISNTWLPISRALLENRLSHLHRLTRAATARLHTEIENSSSAASVAQLRDQADKKIDSWTDWFTKTYVGTLNSKSFTCLILGNEKPDGLARIFETINSTGMALSVFDLLVARLGNWDENGKKVNLRAKVYNDVDKTLLKLFDDEKSLGGSATQQLPRCLALLTKLELKKGDILKRQKSEFKPYLFDVGQRMAKGLNLIRNEMKVIDQSWLPFKDLLTLSYACANDLHDPKDIRRLSAILWIASLIEDWDSNTNDKATKWYDLIRKAMHDAKERKAIFSRLADEFPTFDEVLDAGSKSSGVFKALMTFNLSRGGCDWSGTERTLSVALEDHHLFPKEWINSNKGVPSDKSSWITLRDSVLNRILVTDPANDQAKAQTPPNYLQKLTYAQRRTLQIPESFMGPVPSPIPYDHICAILRDRYDLIRSEFLDFANEALGVSLMQSSDNASGAL